MSVGDTPAARGDVAAEDELDGPDDDDVLRGARPAGNGAV